MALQLLLLASLVSIASAGTYQWIGGTMNFSDPLNWMGGNIPGSLSNGCSTQFGVQGKNIVTQLNSTTYNVGWILYLPLNGVIRLATDGTVIQFSPEVSSTCNSSSPSYVWIGGSTQESRNDFYCHTNWKETDSGAQEPPCIDDAAVFDPYTAYSITASPSTPMIVLNQISFGGTTITSSVTQPLSSLLPQIDLVDGTTTVFVGRTINGQSAYNGICKPLFQYTGSTCKCFSSCPTPAMLANQQDIVSKNQITFAAVLLQQQATNITRNIAGAYSAASLSVTQSQLAMNINNATQNSILASAISSALAAQLPAFSSSFTLSLSNNNLVVNGVAVAANSSFFTPGSITQSPNPIQWTATTAAAPASATRVQTIIQATLPSLMLSYFLAQLADSLAATRSNLPPAANNLANTISNSPNASNALNLSNTDPCFSTCTTDCLSCVASLNATLIAAGVDPAVASNLANSLTTAKDLVNSQGGNWTAVSTNVNTVVTGTSTSTAVAQQQQQATPQIYSVTSSTFYIGRQRYLSDQLRAWANRQAVGSAFYASLRSVATLKSVWNLNIDWIANVGSRRRAAQLLPSALTVSFNYNISCLPNDNVCQSNAASTPLYTSITTQLNNAFNAFTPTAPFCAFITGNLAGTYNMTCLTEAASTYCGNNIALTVPVARDLTKGYLYNMTQCGTQPAYPNGACVDTSYAVYALGNATSISQSCDCAAQGSAAASGGGGGGGGMAFAGAGVGGAFLLIVIIVIVVRRRKSKTASSSSKGKRADDRTVVAFENPMYDDPGNAPQPTYDNSALRAHDSEGLYDEPAFNSINKTNPVYQSTEELNEGGDGAGGYLDVAPGENKAEDVGYLEQAGRAEDVGYLDKGPGADDEYQLPPE